MIFPQRVLEPGHWPSAGRHAHHSTTAAHLSPPFICSLCPLPHSLPLCQRRAVLWGFATQQSTQVRNTRNAVRTTLDLALSMDNTRRNTSHLFSPISPFPSIGLPQSWYQSTPLGQPPMMVLFVVWSESGTGSKPGLNTKLKKKSPLKPV